MGLLDSLIGNLGGAGASPRAPSTSSTSPMVKAIMLLLAAKAAQSMTSRSGGEHEGNISGSSGGLGGLLGGQSGAHSGGLGGLLSGGLGGLLGGAAGGAGASGMIGGLLEQLRGRGFGDHVDSWVGTGQNKQIAPNEMARALGPDTINELEQHTGLPRDQLLNELSHELPSSVDRLTPEGRMMSDDEIWSGKPS